MTTHLILSAMHEAAANYIDMNFPALARHDATIVKPSSPRSAEGLRFDSVHIVEPFFRTAGAGELLDVVRRNSVKNPNGVKWYVNNKLVTWDQVADLWHKPVEMPSVPELLVDRKTDEQRRRQEHYARAEEILDGVERGEMRYMAAADLIAAAHVHALLARA